MPKINIKTKEWKPIDSKKIYYLSIKGLLYSKKNFDGYLLPRIEKETHRIFYMIYRNKKVYLEELYKQIFGKKKVFNKSWYKKTVEFIKKDKEKIIKQRIKKRLQKKRKKSSNPYLRRCHDCGKPTTNYRCDECWAKIRGIKHGRPSINDDLESFLDPDPDNIYTIHIPGGGFYG